MAASECARLEALVRSSHLAGWISDKEASDLAAWINEAAGALSVRRSLTTVELAEAQGFSAKRPSKPVADCRIPGAARRPRKPTAQEIADAKAKAEADKLFGPRPKLAGETRAEFDFEPVPAGMTDSGRGRR